MAAVNEFEGTQKSVIQGASGCFLITPHDTNELTKVTRGLSFAAAGAIAVVMENGDDVIIPAGALAAGIIHPIKIKKIKSTGTTATSLVGWY